MSVCGVQTLFYFPKSDAIFVIMSAPAMNVPAELHIEERKNTRRTRKILFL